jgi:hypothetical protein
VPGEELHSELSAFLWFLDLQQMPGTLDEAVVVIAALDSERHLADTQVPRL